jgi:hypothetical protein
MKDFEILLYWLHIYIYIYIWYLKDKLMVI